MNWLRRMVTSHARALEPGRKSPGAQRPQHRLLHQILCRAGVAGEAERDAVERVEMREGLVFEGGGGERVGHAGKVVLGACHPERSEREAPRSRRTSVTRRAHVGARSRGPSTAQPLCGCSAQDDNSLDNRHSSCPMPQASSLITFRPDA